MPDREVNAETRVNDEKEAAIRRAAEAIAEMWGVEEPDAHDLECARRALDRAGVWERIEELERENERLREALRWVDNCEQGCDVCRVHARAALAASPSETEETG